MLHGIKIYAVTKANRNIFTLTVRWTLMVNVSRKKGTLYRVKSHVNVIYSVLIILMRVSHQKRKEVISIPR